MGTYNEWIDGYVLESTWGTTAIGASNVTAYKLGMLGDRAETVWRTQATSRYDPTALNTREVVAEGLHKVKYITSCAMTLGIQNGVPLYLVQGKSSTSDDDPAAGYYTHTITPTTDGSQIPSVTWQHEKKGSATDWANQYLGAKIARLRLTQDVEKKTLRAIVGWLAQRPTDPGFVLDNAPALPATANESPFNLNNTTVSYNSVDISAYVRGIEFEMGSGMDGIYGHRWDDSNNFEGQWPYDLIEDFRQQYKLSLTVTPWADDVYDDLISITNTAAALKDGYIKFTRDATYDYIQVNFTDLLVLDHPIKTPEQGGDGEIVTIEMEPRAVSITVVDKLTKGNYGE